MPLLAWIVKIVVWGQPPACYSLKLVSISCSLPTLGPVESPIQWMLGIYPSVYLHRVTHTDHLHLLSKSEMCGTLSSRRLHVLIHRKSLT
jgi:hypothetical protein